jgi:hypothetical protein
MVVPTPDRIDLLHHRFQRSNSSFNSYENYSWIQITDSYKGLATFRSATNLSSDYFLER